ncbi:hypothetical protein QBC44DRAFT_333618 [Cladorrhinum sp. PSN332]|nr:hypothetical protein QBC44DRAFT_333618 [Cladorrhinum sp. PSN332]
MNSGSPYGSSISQSTFSFSGGGHSNASSGPSGTAAAGYRLHASQFRSFMSSHSPSASGETFTPQMRDRQARGKDPYTSGNGTDDSDLSDRDLRFGSSGR